MAISLCTLWRQSSREFAPFRKREQEKKDEPRTPSFNGDFSAFEAGDEGAASVSVRGIPFLSTDAGGSLDSKQLNPAPTSHLVAGGELIITRFISEEEGQTLVEYAILLSLLALAIVAAVTLFGRGVAGNWNSSTGQISGAFNSANR